MLTDLATRPQRVSWAVTIQADPGKGLEIYYHALRDKTDATEGQVTCGKVVKKMPEEHRFAGWLYIIRHLLITSLAAGSRVISILQFSRGSSDQNQT